MRFISHRGNLNGRIFNLENTPEYIDAAISKGFDVEVDIRYVNNKWYLGHDAADTEVSIDWIKQRYLSLVLHTKNMAAFQQLTILSLSEDIPEYFWHGDEATTMTSLGDVIVHYAVTPFKNSIAMLPEIFEREIDLEWRGICSDFIEDYKLAFNEKKTTT